jgi:cell division protein FtsL
LNLEKIHKYLCLINLTITCISMFCAIILLVIFEFMTVAFATLAFLILSSAFASLASVESSNELNEKVKKLEKKLDGGDKS